MKTAWFIPNHLILNLVRAWAWNIFSNLFVSLFTKFKWFNLILFALVGARTWGIFAIFINYFSSLWIRRNKCLFYSVLSKTHIWWIRSWSTFWISLSSLGSTLDCDSLSWFTKFIINCLIKTWIWTIISILRCFSLSLRYLIRSYWILIYKVITIFILSWTWTTIIIIYLFFCLEFKWWATFRRWGIILAWS